MFPENQITASKLMHAAMMMKAKMSVLLESCNLALSYSPGIRLQIVTHAISTTTIA